MYFQSQFFYYKTLKKHFKMFTKFIIKLLQMTKLNDFEWFCLYFGMDINGRVGILEGKNLLYFYQTTVLHYIWHTYKSQNVIGKYGKSLYVTTHCLFCNNCCIIAIICCNCCCICWNCASDIKPCKKTVLFYSSSFLFNSLPFPAFSRKYWSVLQSDYFSVSLNFIEIHHHQVKMVVFMLYLC